MMLSGIRVVECSQVLSAPYAGMILADLGAEVIKVEKPPAGDEARHMGPAFRDGASMTFHDVNRNKQSVQIDLKSAQGHAQMLALISTADIFIHNLRPGDADRLKLDAVTLTALFPRLIHCEMGAFGHTGPRRHQPGYEPLMQAYGGLISMTGGADTPPARIPASLVDEGTGMWTVIAALAALQRRHASGRGAVINTSLLETAVGWAAPRIHEWVNEGRVPRRYGTGHANLVPYQTFEASDGLLMICAGNDRLFAAVADTLGHTEWQADARFKSNRERLRHRDLLVGLMTDVLRTRTRAEWAAALQAAGVPVSPVHSIEEVATDPQVRALDLLRPVPGADYMLVGLPMSIDGARPEVRRPAPTLGQDQARLDKPAAPGGVPRP